MTLSLQQILGGLALAGIIFGWGADHQAQLNEHAKLSAHIQVLEQIIVSQFPEWTAAISWKD